MSGDALEPGGLSVLAVRRAIARIESELATILDEPRTGDRFGWYALDRFAAIAKVAQAAAGAHEDAALDGYHAGSQERATLSEHLDAWILRDRGRVDDRPMDAVDLKPRGGPQGARHDLGVTAVGPPDPGRATDAVKAFLVVSRSGRNHGLAYLFLAGAPPVERVEAWVRRRPDAFPGRAVVIDLGESFATPVDARKRIDHLRPRLPAAGFLVGDPDDPQPIRA